MLLKKLYEFHYKQERPSYKAVLTIRMNSTLSISDDSANYNKCLVKVHNEYYLKDQLNSSAIRLLFLNMPYASDNTHRPYLI